MTKYSLRSQKAFDDFLHFKVKGRLFDKSKQKSFFDFANPEMNETAKKDEQQKLADQLQK